MAGIPLLEGWVIAADTLSPHFPVKGMSNDRRAMARGEIGTAPNRSGKVTVIMVLKREQTYRLLRRTLCGAVASAALLGAAIGGAYAQQPGPGTDGPAGGTPPTEESTAWIKLCTTDEQTQKEQCLVTQELRDGDSGQLLASASLRMGEGEQTLLIFTVPIGVLLPPGIRLQIDNAEAQTVPYTICFPNACIVRLEVDDNFVAGLKRGSQMTVSVMNAERKAIGFPLTLIGFTKAFDGPPIPQDVYAEARKKLSEEIERRAEAARKKQEQEQGQGEEQGDQSQQQPQNPQPQNPQ